MNMKKLIIAVALLLTLICTLPLSVFAEESITEALTEATVDTSADTATTTDTAETSEQTLCECTEAPATQYCPICGGLNTAYDATHWDCTCGAVDNTTPYCPQCGEQHPDSERFWTCHTCQQENNFYDACGKCGAARPSDEDQGAKFEILPDTLKETLPIMGMGMLGIFLVTLTIIIAVLILRWFGNQADSKKQE